MKEYYVYDAELRGLKKTGAITTILFGLGSASLGFAINVHVGMIFAGTIDPAIQAQWTTYKTIAFIAAGIFYLFAVLEALSGYNEVERIKAETYHGPEKYKAKSGYKVAFWALILVSCIIAGAILRPAVGI